MVTFYWHILYPKYIQYHIVYIKNLIYNKFLLVSPWSTLCTIIWVLLSGGRDFRRGYTSYSSSSYLLPTRLFHSFFVTNFTSSIVFLSTFFSTKWIVFLSRRALLGCCRGVRHCLRSSLEWGCFPVVWMNCGSHAAHCLAFIPLWLPSITKAIHS